MQEEVQEKNISENTIKVLLWQDAKDPGETIFTEGDVEQIEQGFNEEQMERDKELYSRGCAVLKEGEIVDGHIIAVRGSDVMVDIGFKSEGLLALDEFADENPEAGQNISVFLEALEDENGQVVISKKRADFIRVWDTIKDAYETKEPLQGKIKKRIKGGMVVDLLGVDAFLPGSQIALRPVPDFDALVGEDMDFRVIKLNKTRRNIVVSHRIILEEQRGQQRDELLNNIEENQIREGVVKNITDFGVFIDLGGMDGLLHITDMSWTRINHPSEMVKIGDSINIKILKYDKDKQRISLGLKQLVPSPWDDVEKRFPAGEKVAGKVVNLTKYGAFVRLDEGIEGLVHVSEMSWTKHVTHPSEILEVGQEIECVVLDVDKENHKISLGIKQLEPDPWKVAAEKYSQGTTVSGAVRNLTAFGAFVEIEEGIEGLVHISDISWTRRVNHPSEFFKRGQQIEAVVLEIDSENHRIALGYKQLMNEPWPELGERYRVGAETEGRIIHMTDRGVIVELPDNVEGFVPVTQLGKRVDRPQDAFSENDIIPLKVIEFEQKDHRIVLSVNAYFESREQRDLDRYVAAHPTKMISLGEVAKVTRSEPKKEKPVEETATDNTPDEATIAETQTELHEEEDSYALDEQASLETAAEESVEETATEELTGEEATEEKTEETVPEEQTAEAESEMPVGEDVVDATQALEQTMQDAETDEEAPVEDVEQEFDPPLEEQQSTQEDESREMPQELSAPESSGESLDDSSNDENSDDTIQSGEENSDDAPQEDEIEKIQE